MATKKKSAKKAPVKKKAASSKKSSKKPLKATPAKSAKKISKPKVAARPSVSRISTRLVPVMDGVLLKREAQLEKTAGGLFIPSTAQDRPLQGRVIAIGSGRRNKKGAVRPLDVKVGDQVLFSKYTGTEVKIDGQEFLLLKEPEILGVVD